MDWPHFAQTTGRNLQESARVEPAREEKARKAQDDLAKNNHEGAGGKRLHLGIYEVNSNESTAIQETIGGPILLDGGKGHHHHQYIFSH